MQLRMYKQNEGISFAKQYQVDSSYFPLTMFRYSFHSSMRVGGNDMIYVLQADNSFWLLKWPMVGERRLCMRRCLSYKELNSTRPVAERSTI
jgi:hypothetical protein